MAKVQKGKLEILFGPETPNYALLNEQLRKAPGEKPQVELRQKTSKSVKKGPSQPNDKKPT